MQVHITGVLSHCLEFFSCQTIDRFITGVIGNSAVTSSSGAALPLAAANGPPSMSVKVNAKRQSAETPEYLFQQSISEEVCDNLFTLL